MKTNSGILNVLFGCEKEDICETVIITPFLPVEKFVGTADRQKVFRGRLYSGIKAPGYTVIKCPMGASLAGDSVLFLGTTKAERIIYAGSCGGLGSAQTGDIVICDKAFSGGGFSDYYLPGKGIEKILGTNDMFPASSELVEEIWRRSHGFKSPEKVFKKGDIFTIASLFAETPEDMRKIEAHGFYGIDMELSAVYHAADVAGMKAAGILFVSDLPLEKPFWETSSSGEKEKLKASAETVIKLSLLAAGVEDQ